MMQRFEVCRVGGRTFGFDADLLAEIEGDDDTFGSSRLMLWRRPTGNWAAGRFRAGADPLNGHVELIWRHAIYRGRYVIERDDEMMWAEAMIIWEWSRLAQQLTAETSWIEWNAREPNRWNYEDRIATRLASPARPVSF